MNPFSKTNSPCDCGWLAGAINDPESGVVFDPESNTILLSPGRSEYPLYHCPFCGGVFPDSSQPVWVPIVPKAEFERVEQLIAGLTDADAIISRLGAPDYDAMMYSHKTRNGALVRDDTSPPTRNIEYYRYSDWLAIEFYITDRRGAEHQLVIKNISR